MFMLGDFIRVLRATNVRVSTVESIDAAKAVETVGLADRTLLKHVLGQVLAKTIEEKATFADCFDAYFTHDAFTAPTEDADHSAQNPDESPDVPKLEKPQDSEKKSLVEMLDTDDQAALATSLAMASEAANISAAQLFTQTGIFTMRIVEAMGLSELDAERRLTRAQMENGDDTGSAARAARLDGYRARLFEQVRDYVEKQIAMRTANIGRILREEALSRIKLSNLDRSDMKVMRSIIQKLAKRLASRHARRRKKARHGVLDIRKSLRSNQKNDGLLFDLIWKRKKIDRPKLFVICDVSNSVAQVARFLLMLLHSLDEIIPHTRSFAFSNRLGEISDMFDRADSFDGDHVENVMTQILRLYGAGSTDYGRAFADLNDVCGKDIDRRSTVLILGDGRSNFGDPGHGVLKDIYYAARRIIWLNPEPKQIWNTGDSEMKRLGAYCHHVQTCNSIRHLEKVMDDMLRMSV